MRKAIMTTFAVLVLAAMPFQMGVAISNAIGYTSPFTYWDIAILTATPIAFLTSFVALRRASALDTKSVPIPILCALASLLPATLLANFFFMPIPVAIVADLIVGILCGWGFTQDAIGARRPSA